MLQNEQAVLLYHFLHGYNALIQGNVTLDGTAQQLGADTECRSVNIQSNPTNANPVYVGNADTVSATVHMYVLTPGSSVRIPAKNINLIYVIGTGAELVSYGGEI